MQKEEQNIKFSNVSGVIYVKSFRLKCCLMLKRNFWFDKAHKFLTSTYSHISIILIEKSATLPSSNIDFALVEVWQKLIPYPFAPYFVDRTHIHSISYYIVVNSSFAMNRKWSFAFFSHLFLIWINNMNEFLKTWSKVSYLCLKLDYDYHYYYKNDKRHLI